MNARKCKSSDGSQPCIKAENVISQFCIVRLWFPSKLLNEDTKELDIYETEFARNLKGLVAIATAIATAVRKKDSPRPSPRSSFPRHPHAENEPAIAVRGSRPPPPLLCISAYIFPSPEHAENTEKWKIWSGKKSLCTLRWRMATNMYNIFQNKYNKKFVHTHSQLYRIYSTVASGKSGSRMWRNLPRVYSN